MRARTGASWCTSPRRWYSVSWDVLMESATSLRLQKLSASAYQSLATDESGNRLAAASNASRSTGSPPSTPTIAWSARAALDLFHVAAGGRFLERSVRRGHRIAHVAAQEALRTEVVQPGPLARAPLEPGEQLRGDRDPRVPRRHDCRRSGP